MRLKRHMIRPYLGSATPCAPQDRCPRSRQPPTDAQYLSLAQDLVDDRALTAGQPDWSASRARLSALPSTVSTSKMPGEVVRPVSAARNGCATAPSFAPRPSAKPRTACSVASVVQ